VSEATGQENDKLIFHSDIHRDMWMYAGGGVPFMLATEFDSLLSVDLLPGAAPRPPALVGSSGKGIRGGSVRGGPLRGLLGPPSEDER